MFTCIFTVVKGILKNDFQGCMQLFGRSTHVLLNFSFLVGVTTARNMYLVHVRLQHIICT